MVFQRENRTVLVCNCKWLDNPGNDIYNEFSSDSEWKLSFGASSFLHAGFLYGYLGVSLYQKYHQTGFVEVHLIHCVYECEISVVAVSNVSFFNGYNVSI